MPEEKRNYNPLDKVHLPRPERHRDDGSGTASERKFHLLPWKRHRDDGSGTVSETQPLIASPAPDSHADSADTATQKKKKHNEKQTTTDTADPSLSKRVRVWDVEMPPSQMKMVEGVLVPSAIGGTFGAVLIRNRRRLSIEIHASNGSPPASLLRGDSFTKKNDTESSTLSAGDIVEVRVLKPISKTKGSDRGQHAAKANAEVWVTEYVFGLDNFKIIKTRDSHIEMRLGIGDETQMRYVNFSNEKDAKSFQQVIDNLKEMGNKLKEQRLAKFRKLYPNMLKSGPKQIRLLVEVVSAINLPEVDGDAPNPYVIVSLGASNECHRTSSIRGTVNPIWTIASGSLFLLNVSPEEFFGSAQGLSFFVQDDAAMTSRNDTLGKTFVAQEVLLKGDGARVEYDLESVGHHQIVPVEHGFNQLYNKAKGLVTDTETQFEGEIMGLGNERLHPLHDVRKLVHGDSDDDEEESGLDKILLRPASDVQRLVRGDSEGDKNGGVGLASDPFSWIRNRAQSDTTRAGKLVLRIRMASDEDVAFMDRLASAQKEGTTGLYSEESFVQPHVSQQRLPRHEERKVDKERQYRVKPHPDPSRPEEETKWMTEAELDVEALKPSNKWIETGSGDLGKLFVEVIGCDGLPNMDYKELGEGKTDAFACLVYEDAIVNTEVIKNTLSPRWMPWTQRAFIFNVLHPSSDLMIGVLDYDSPAPMAQHDPIGRAEIDVTNMRPGTEYTFYFDLYPSAMVKKRTAKGSIKLRIRLELHSERKALLAALRPPPQMYVNVATYRDYRVCNFVIEGKYDIHVFDMNLFTEYVEDLTGTGLALVPILKDAVYTVVFWRGHFPVILRVPRFPPLSADDNVTLWNRFTKSTTIRLPLHSAVAFVGGVLLVENYNLIPSFVLFSIAWLFLAMSDNINRNPSPWRQPRSFAELMGVLIWNSSPVKTIEPNQNKNEIENFLAKEAEVQTKLEQEAKEEMKEEENAEDTVGNVETTKAVDMETKIQNFDLSMNPFKFVLYPMQQKLELARKSVYIARSFIMWKECYYCYWIVISSIAGGLIVLFVPWGWLIRWILRIGVWVFLGPWMKLLDIYHNGMQKNQTTQEARNAAEARAKAKYRALVASTTRIQAQKEDLVKLKDMEKYMFGKYLAVLPRFKQQRSLDRALVSSYASPHVPGGPIDISSRKYGQHLTGEMIPRREIDKPTSA